MHEVLGGLMISLLLYVSLPNSMFYALCAMFLLLTSVFDVRHNSQRLLIHPIMSEHGEFGV